MTGVLFREFAFTLAGAVIVSGFIALTLSPMMCSKLLRHQKSESWFARTLDRSFLALRRGYKRRLHSTLNFRALTILISGDPNDFTVRTGIGKWLEHLGVAALSRGGPGRPAVADQDAAGRQPRLYRAGDRPPIRADQGDPRNLACVHHQRLS